MPLLFCAALAPGVGLGQAARFAAGVDGAWTYRETAELCELVHAVPSYGEARFVAAAGAAPEFELQTRLDWHSPGSLVVAAVAPDWHRGAPDESLLGEVSHIEGGGGVVRGPLAGRMLLELREGRDLEVFSPSWIGSDVPVEVTLAAARFEPAYAAWSACARTNVNVSWAQMSRSRVAFATDEHTLDEADERLLAGIARYVAQDSTVTRIYVDGHTDSSGTKIGNYRLAKRRAETVAGRLKSILDGLGADSELVVRYHGAAYPVADNETPEGKAANRRATVRLERGAAASLASQRLRR